MVSADFLFRGWPLILKTILLASRCPAQTPIPSTFFGVSAVEGVYPRVSVGTLAHSDFAWTRIEPSRGKRTGHTSPRSTPMATF
jgi:hypothetical protein